MTSKACRTSQTESIVSFFLLIVLAIIATVIIAVQADFDLSQFGVAASAVTSSQAEQSSSKATPEKLYHLKGFVPVTDIQEYTEDNLYEKINGKAPMYVDAGFVKLTTQVLSVAGNDQLTMELYLYDMGTAKNAFSVYSIQKRADSQMVPNYMFGYKTANALYFVRNKYYVEMIGFSQSDELLDKMIQLGSVLLKDHPAVTITELNYFPKENLIPASYKLYLTSAFSCDELKDVFAANYDLNGQKVTAFFGKRKSPEEAQRIAATYYNFLQSMDAEEKQMRNGEFSARVFDVFGYTEIIFTTGSFLGGIHQAEDQKAAEQLAEVLFEKLSSISNK